MSDNSYKSYVTAQINLYLDVFEAIERDDLRDKFDQLIKSSYRDPLLHEKVEEVNEKERNGLLKHLPKTRGMLSYSSVAFAEIVRLSVLSECMFSLVNPAVRNFIFD